MTASNEQVGGTHYIEMNIEPWDVVDGWPIEQRIGYYRGNAIKYLLRMGSKDEQLQEIRKAGHYCAKLAEVLEGATPDLNTCPKCSGEADNGHDRCYPPTAYLCSKCQKGD